MMMRIMLSDDLSLQTCDDGVPAQIFALRVDGFDGLDKLRNS